MDFIVSKLDKTILKYIAGSVMLCAIIRRVRQYIRERSNQGDEHQGLTTTGQPKYSGSSTLVKLKVEIEEDEYQADEASNEVVHSQVQALADELEEQLLIQQLAKRIVIEAFEKAQESLPHEESVRLDRVIYSTKHFDSTIIQANAIIVKALKSLTSQCIESM